MNDLEAKLMEDLPRDAVSTRKQAGMNLSYVDGFYVKDRLCQLFGPLGFDTSVDSLTCIGEAEVDGKHRVGYTATVTLFIPLGASDGSRRIVTKQDVGFGQGIDKDAQKAHESATKEAVTDALKRAAVLLGRSMGLALYDKEQRYVSGEPAAKAPPKKRAPKTKEDPVSESDADELLALIEHAGTVESLESLRPRVREHKGETKNKLIAAFKARKTALAA